MPTTIPARNGQAALLQATHEGGALQVMNASPNTLTKPPSPVHSQTQRVGPTIKLLARFVAIPTARCQPATKWVIDPGA